MTFIGIIENIVADIIFIVLAILLPWLWFYFSQRRKLQSFFHTLNTRRLVIYLSDLNVLPFGAIGTSGKKLSFQGHAVAYGEMQGAMQLKNLFSFIIPKLAETFQSIGTMFLSDATAQIVISPTDKKTLEKQASIIALGSAAYNVAAGYIEDSGKGIAKFQFGSMRLSDLVSQPTEHPPTAYSDTDTNTYPGTVNSSTQTTQPGTVHVDPEIPYTTQSGMMPPGDRRFFPFTSELLHHAIDADLSGGNKPSAILVEGIPPITDTTYGFVERIIDKKENRALFYIAGLSEFSTQAATYYLASHWFDLHKKYGADKSFIVMLQFDPNDIHRWFSIWEREIS